MRSLTRLLAVLLCLSLGACFLVPHKIDVQQGNYVDQTMLSKLKAGMTKSQVRYVLGSPLITDPFHAERWDYTFIDRPNGKLKASRRVTVIFEGDKLSRLQGDVPPLQKEATGDLTPPATGTQKGS